MAEFLNWRIVESMTGWARHRDDAEVAHWDEGAASWDRRTRFERAFTQAQVDAIDVLPTDSVLDACCGAGRLTIPLARKARCVTGLDGGENMLSYCEAYAKREGLDNVTTLHVPNWHSVMPGVDFPQHDVAVACISPASADVVKFSRAATRRCYVLSFNTPFKFMDVQASLFAGVNDAWPEDPRSTLEAMQLSSFDIPRVFGVNVPFNVLFDLGASPEISYVSGCWEYEAESREELYEFLSGFGAIDPGREGIFRSNVDKCVSQTDGGLLRYASPEAQMYVLSWDPNDIDWERADAEAW